MTIIFKGQHIMTGLPEMRRDAQDIRYITAVARTHQDGGSGLRISQVPALHLMVAVQRWKGHRFRGKTQLKGTEGIEIKSSTFFGACKRFYNVERHSKHYPHQADTATQPTNHHSLQR